MTKRILLKLSGELLGERAFEAEKVESLAEEIAKTPANIELALVLGGGNIWRGRDAQHFSFPAAESDHIGMAATILNASVLQKCLQKKGKKVRVFSPLAFPLLSELHSVQKEKEALKKGEIIIFAGGTGAPFFTTDSAAVLRALEIEADLVLKGTKVDGIYSADPTKDPKAQKFEHISYLEALQKNLKIMDGTAFEMAKEHQLPLFVFNALVPGNIQKALQGKSEGSWVR